MKPLAVKLTERAKHQIARQVCHIAIDSVDNAIAWEDRLRAAIAKLGEAYGYAVDEAASARVGHLIRRYPFEGNYLIHFVVDEANGVLEVVSFRHVARLPRPGEF